MKTVTELPPLVVLAWGLCYLSVCVTEGTEPEEIERLANMEVPTGISSRWAISKDKTFANGPANPSACPDATRRTHYLLEC